LAQAPAGGQQGGAPQGGQALGGVSGPRRTGPSKPAPRSADGKMLLTGATPSDKGVWLPAVALTTHLAPLETVPFQPWARKLYDERQLHRFEPHTRCNPSGASRQFQTPYGVEFVEMSAFQRIYIFDIGGPHTWRTVYMDGRTHPRDLTPTHYGHSIGWWEGDTLVIDTVGYNERFWLDRAGMPHTEHLRTLEKLTRTNADTIVYEITFDDLHTYTAKWTAKFDLRWEPGTELFEYVCQQQNYAGDLMVGDVLTKVERLSPIVP
jgi:hypothetical protein